MKLAALETPALILDRSADVAMVLDNVVSAQMVAERGGAMGVEFPVMIEIDCDGHRSGIRPGAAALIDIGRILPNHACATAAAHAAYRVINGGTKIDAVWERFSGW